jgi:uncharacterized protein (TIGR00369 family)
MATDLPPGAGVMLRSFVESEQGLLSALGADLARLEAGAVTIEIPADEALADPDGQVPRGVGSTLVESVGELAVRTLTDDPVNAPVETVTLNAKFLAAADGALAATAEAARIDDGVGVSSVAVEAETDGEPVVTGQVVFNV